MDPKTPIEMERGRLIAGRAQRHSDLARYIKAKKVVMACALPGNPHYIESPRGEVHIFYVNGVQIGIEPQWQDDYPSELLMAKIGLCVAATVGFDGIPDAMTIDPEVRRRRDEYKRNHVVDWSDK